MDANILNSTIIFNGDITPMALSYSIPEGFSGNIVVTGSIRSKSENPEIFENLSVNLNGGDFYVLKNIYNISDISIDGNLYCFGKIRPTFFHEYANIAHIHEIKNTRYFKVNGDVYVANNFKAPHVTVVSGNFTSESKVTVYSGYNFTVLGSFESAKLCVDNIESTFDVKGYMYVSNGFSIKFITKK